MAPTAARMRLAQVSLLLCGATAYVPAFSTHRPTRPTRPAAARLAMPVAATTGARTGGDGRRSPRRKESAANALLQKIDGLRSTRAVPVDATGLSSLVRPLADGLRGPMLLEVLSGLRQRGKWETALALAQMVEANAPAAPPAGRTPRYGAPAAPMNAPGRKEISGRTGGAPEWERRAGRDDLASRGGAMGRDAEGGSGLASLEDSDALLARARAAAAAISSGRGYSGDGYSEDGYSWDEADEGDEFGAGVAAGPPLETVHYNVLLSTLAVARRWREALDLLTRMRERSVPRDTITYNAAITVMKACGKWKLALKLLRKMRNEGIPPDTITFSAAIAACSRDGEWRTALRLLDLGRQAGVPPNTITYSAAVSACEKGGAWAQALRLLVGMREEGVAPDLITFNAAIGACARAGEWERAVSLLKEGMPKADVTPDVVSYNAALTAHANALPPRPAEARALLDSMAASGVMPERISYNALISALGRAGQWEEAVGMLRSMERGELQHGASAPLRPDAITYTAAISAAADSSQAQAAVEILGDLRATGLPLSTLPFSRAIAAQEAAGDAHAALRLLQDITEEGLKHNAITVKMVLRAAAGAGLQAQALRQLLQILSASDAAGAPPPADAETLTLAKEMLDTLAAHAPAGDSEDQNSLDAQNSSDVQNSTPDLSTSEIAALRSRLKRVQVSVTAAEARAAAAVKRAEEDDLALAEIGGQSPK